MRRTIGSTGISVQQMPKRTIPGAARDDQHQSDDIGDFFSPERNRGERPDEDEPQSCGDSDPPLCPSYIYMAAHSPRLPPRVIGEAV
jgi:hypothetical protein